MLAMAMQESTHLDVRERDVTKDYVNGKLDKAANATLFNLSIVSVESSTCTYCCTGVWGVAGDGEGHTTTLYRGRFCGKGPYLA
jgi:hypothetical protein